MTVNVRLKQRRRRSTHKKQLRRWPKVKNDSISMSSDSSLSGNTRHQAGLRRAEHPHPSRVPPRPILQTPHTGKPLHSPAWLLVDPPHTTPPYSPTPLESAKEGLVSLVSRGTVNYALLFRAAYFWCHPPLLFILDFSFSFMAKE